MKKNKKKKEKVHSEFYITCKENITEFLSDKRNLIITAICFVMLLLIILVVAIFSKTAMSRERILTRSLEEMAIDYYENYYFEQLGLMSSGVSREEFLANFASIGIKINLENLEAYKDGVYEKEIEKFTKPKKKSCNKYNTKAIIYPKKPYGKKDYEIKIELECTSLNEKK